LFRKNNNIIFARYQNLERIIVSKRCSSQKFVKIMKRKISCLTKLKLLNVMRLSFVCLFALTALAWASEGYSQQQLTVSGTVISADDGEAIPGVTIMIRGTSTGTVTNVNGVYTLGNVPANAVLQFSYVGMTTQDVPVESRTTINVTMREDRIGLEEVIVVGYGTQRRESIVGSITQTSGEELARKGNVTNLTQALSGMMPGVITITSTGEPGVDGSTNIYVRGQNTWNGGQPLILVDGMERVMDNIDVNEVETISVLKDASATAVFGVKGANGVILITTKRGAIGKPELSFSFTTTGKTVSKLPAKMDSYNSIRIKNEAIEREVSLFEPSWGDYLPYDLVSRYKLPQDPQYREIYHNVDWEKAVFEDYSLSHRATLNVRGGTNFVNYFGSLAYLNEGDMFKQYDNYKGYNPGFDYNRFNFRSNFDFSLTSTTTFRVDLSGYYAHKQSTYGYGSAGTLWGAIYYLPPNFTQPQFSDGRFGYADILNTQNPVDFAFNSGIQDIRTTEMNSDFSLVQKLDFITQGLSARGSLSYDNRLLSSGGIWDDANNTNVKYVRTHLYTGPDQDPSEYTQYLPTKGTNNFDFAVVPWSLRQEGITTGSIMRRMQYQFQLNWARRFDVHNFGAMGLVKREEYAIGSMFKNFREDWVFRATYDYDARYLLEINGAYNGSEQFGPGYRFDFFPSVAAGWFVSNEKFFDVDWVSSLKLRYSLGLVGDDRVSGGRWLYQSQLQYGGTNQFSILNQYNYGWGDHRSPYTWYKESIVGNPDIHWEKAIKANYGVELGLLNNMFFFTYDYFTEERTDILIAGSSRTVPPFFGAVPPSANLGRVNATGHELEIKFNNTTREMRYWATVGLSHNRNEILYREDPALLAGYLKQEGYTIGQTRSLIRDGFMNNWDEVYASVPHASNDLQKFPGGYNILDFNADGSIRDGEDNAPIVYSNVPRNTYSLAAGTTFKGFSVMAQLYGVYNVSRFTSLPSFRYNSDLVFEHTSDHWSKDNQDASSFLPRWKTQGLITGDYFIYDASYLRLKTAEVAYTFQQGFLQNAGISRLRLYLNGENLLFWSDLPDDRESGSGAAYPTQKRINLGVNLTF
jgi:TonB-linked SusC/RagA family outer membrane protein